MLKSCKHNSKRDCPTFNPSYLYLICNLEDISSFSSLNSAIIHHQNVLYGSNESKEMSRTILHSQFNYHTLPVTPFKPLSIYKFGLSVCLFVSNKRQNGWTDQAQFFCGTIRDHREGLRMIKILKNVF